MYPFPSGKSPTKFSPGQYILVVGPDDVQLGRGRPVVTSVGNQRFHTLVLEYKSEYHSSNRHSHKDQVARKILSIISERGGRFLKKVNLSSQSQDATSSIAWEIADEDTSLNKVKQALRENDPSDGKVVAASSKSLAVNPKAQSVLNVAPPAKKAATGKRSRESKVTSTMSLSESIRLNASKLGDDFSPARATQPTIRTAAHSTTTSNSLEFPNTSYAVRASALVEPSNSIGLVSPAIARYGLQQSLLASVLTGDTEHEQINRSISADKTGTETDSKVVVFTSDKKIKSQLKSTADDDVKPKPK